jgi:hypothetical protein
MIKLAVIGGREFNDNSLLTKTLNKEKHRISTIVSGGAKGADKMAENWAIENDIPTKIFYPEWKKWGPRAGPRRNTLIIDECDECIAFWDGKSKGTAHSISLCKNNNKPITIVRYETIY